jgi:hypothetical protein
MMSSLGFNSGYGAPSYSSGYGYSGYPQTIINSPYGYNSGYYNQVPCVTNLSMNIGHYNGTLYAGQVFLYLPGGGFVLQF